MEVNIIMSLKKANLNLIWRVCGANALLIIVGILTMSKNTELSMYTIAANLSLILFFSYKILKKGLTMKSECFDVLLIYVVYKVVMTFVMIDTEQKSILTTLSTIIEGLWIYKWYLFPKFNDNK